LLTIWSIHTSYTHLIRFILSGLSYLDSYAEAMKGATGTGGIETVNEGDEEDEDDEVPYIYASILTHIYTHLFIYVNPHT